jgi:sortase A
MAQDNTIHRATRNRQRIWLWVENALLVSGLGLLAVFGIARIDRSIGSYNALKSFSTRSFVEASSLPTRELTGQIEAPLSMYQRSAHSESSVPLALLRIPRIRLIVPVLDGTDARTLNHGAGHIPGTARPGEIGNIGVAAHRDGFFRGLKDIEKGDVLQLETAKGTDVYIVNQIRIVAPSDVSVLRPRPESSLTLVTCYPFHFIGSAPKRFIVTAALRKHSVAGSEIF